MSTLTSVLMAIALGWRQNPQLANAADVLNLSAERVTTWWEPVTVPCPLSSPILHDDAGASSPSGSLQTRMLAPHGLLPSLVPRCRQGPP